MDWKDLEKMTVLKVREEALKYPEIQGVHGKHKEQLMEEIAKALHLESKRTELEGERARLEGEIRDASARQTLGLTAERRLGMHIPTDKQVVILPRATR